MEPTVTQDELIQAHDAAMVAQQPVDSPSPQPVAAVPSTEPIQTEAAAPIQPVIPAPAQLPQEPEDPALRSQLGRKVASQAQELDFLKAEIADLKQRKSVDVPAEFPSTPEELQATINLAIDAKTRSDKEAQLTYQRSFIAKADAMAREEGMSADEHNAVLNELFEHHNERVTNDPVRDAEILYNRSYLSVLKKKMATDTITTPSPINPLKGAAPLAPLGVTTGSSAPPVAPKAIQLDAHAAEFVRMTGMSQKSVEEALSGPPPAYLTGGR